MFYSFIIAAMLALLLVPSFLIAAELVVMAGLLTALVNVQWL